MLGRRSFLKGIMGGAAAVATGSVLAEKLAAAEPEPTMALTGTFTGPISVTKNGAEIPDFDYADYCEQWVDETVAKVGPHTHAINLPALSDGHVTAQPQPDMTVRIRPLTYVDPTGTIRRYEGTDAFPIHRQLIGERYVLCLDHETGQPGLYLVVGAGAIPLAQLHVYPGMLAITDADLTDWRHTFSPPLVPAWSFEP